MMQTAVMGTKYRSGFHFIFDLRINLDMISQVLVPVGGPLAMHGENLRKFTETRAAAPRASHAVISCRS
jgi:hypothetical protein